MKAQNYRPKVQAGTLANRRTLSPASNSTTRSRNSRNQSARRKAESRGQGARVIWILMLVGGLIGSGFVMAQHSQINVHQFKQAEEKVKTQLDELTNQQRYLALEKERVINTQESDRIAKQSGLMQPKLERTAALALTAEPATKPSPVAKASPALAAKAMAKPENRLAGKSAIKSTANPATKPATKLVKPGKSAQLTSLTKAPAKPSAVKPVSRIAPTGKVAKSGKNQQLAQRQETKKDRRR